MPTKDWYQSTGVWGGIIAAISPLVYAVFHFSLTPDASATIAMALAGVGGLIAMIGRMRATSVIVAPVKPQAVPHAPPPAMP